MDRIDISLGSLADGAGRPRTRFRRLSPDEQAALAEAVTKPVEEQSLVGYIPSALISTEQRLRALAIGGAPAWSRRLKRMDSMIDQALEQLEVAWRALSSACDGNRSRFASEWRAQAERFDFSAINELVRRHNLYFPAEANLAMDVRTGDFIGLGGGDYRRYPLDAAWVLERFPPDHDRALD